MTQLCHRGPLSAQLHPYGALYLSLLLSCLQGLSAAPRVRPSPLLAISCSQWAQRSTFGSGKTSTSPWQSSRPLRGEPRRGLHPTYPPLKRDALCRGIISRKIRRPTVGPSPPCATRVAAPRASAVLPSHPRPRVSWDPRSPTRSARRPRVPPRHRAMLFVSSHYGHARGTLCFFPARPIRLGLPMMSVHLRLPPPRFVTPPDTLRPQATCSFLATAYHVRPLNAVPGHPLSRPRHRSRRHHSSGAVPHVSDGNRPVRRC